jgi:peptidyl-prolyl cis-trans isomerase B (cyclophilin B)
MLGLAGCGDGPEAGNPTVEIVTNMGKIRAELYEKKSPITVKNFLQYVDEKHYDGTIFHRVMPDFMIQGGGFKPGLIPVLSKHDPIENESFNGLLNSRGTLAMARTTNPNSATDQFFINVKDNPALDQINDREKWGYAVFGRVYQGMNVVDDIRKVPTRDEGRHEAVPRNDVVIESIRRIP